MLIDEADSFFKREDGSDVEALRGILNSGHERGGMFVRTVGEDHQPKGFKTFSPLCYAWLVKRGRQVALTLADRSITIELRRKMRKDCDSIPARAHGSPPSHPAQNGAMGCRSLASARRR
jgi:hypothetical protein